MTALPKMSIDPQRPGMIRFDDIPMGGMLAGVSAPEIVRACNSYEEMLATLKLVEAALMVGNGINRRSHPIGGKTYISQIKAAIAKAENL